MCGRLRCCLIFEYEQYAAALKEMPRKGRKVITPSGDGKIIDFNLLKETVVVIIENTGKREEFPREEIAPWKEAQALREKAQQGCKIHGEGGCSCKTDESKI